MSNLRDRQDMVYHVLPSTKVLLAAITMHFFSHKRIEYVILMIIFGIAIFARLYALDASSLWSDEGNTWALMGRSFGQIAQDAAADIHPPGYYWLLKIWTMFFGIDVNGLRSFSVLVGVLLVFVIYKIGNQLESKNSTQLSPLLLGIIAAFITAINPFQIYYSQEARMYILLALESAGLFWAVLGMMKELPRTGWMPSRFGWLFLLCGVAGLWTHYSFPIVLLAAACAYLGHFLFNRANPFYRFILLNLILLLFYLPWLPTAIERVLNWPKGGGEITLIDGLYLTLQTLSFGPIRPLLFFEWGWLFAAALLPILGLFTLERHRGLLVIGLWLFAPILLMFSLGLFTDAFLKFLLVASPAWALLVAASPKMVERILPKDRASYTLGLQILLVIGIGLFSYIVLPTYYTNPFARDNYAGVAQYVQVLGDTESDLVLLNAPGQQEVWDYYDPGLKTLALPKQRPPNPDQTIALLAEQVGERSQIFALFWAMDEADPEQLVERWLDQNAFKGLDSWQGNLRFVTYSLPNQLSCMPTDILFQNDTTPKEQIRLEQQCQPAFPQQVAAGEVALFGFQWHALTEIAHRYKVTVQLLDARNQVIVQRDSEPVGGSMPTDQWTADTTVLDNHGLVVPPGTPPRLYRLIVALYHSETGQRLHTEQTDFIELGQIEILRPTENIPPEIFPIPYRLDRQLGLVHLLGYGLHRKGFAHSPLTPINTGDLVHLTLYWQAPDPLPDDWAEDLHFTIELGKQSVTAPLAGGNYPTGQWQSGEFVRGEFDILFDGGDRVPRILIGDISQQLHAIPD